MIRSVFKRLGVYIGGIAGLVTIVAVAAGLYTMSSDIADLKRSDMSQDILIQNAVNAAHEKELACKDVVHAVNLAKLEYKYCK